MFVSKSFGRFCCCCSGRLDGQRDLDAAQLFALVTQNHLDPVVPVGQPVGQVHVGHVDVGGRQRVRALRSGTRTVSEQNLYDRNNAWQTDTHGLEGAVAGQAAGVQRFWTVLARRKQLVQEITAVLVVTAADFLHARDFHPDHRHLLLQSHVQLQDGSKPSATSGSELRP